MVTRRTYRREDVRELGTVAVTTADDLLLVVVEVRARQQMAEDELRYVALLQGGAA